MQPGVYTGVRRVSAGKGPPCFREGERAEASGYSHQSGSSVTPSRPRYQDTNLNATTLETRMRKPSEPTTREKLIKRQECERRNTIQHRDPERNPDTEKRSGVDTRWWGWGCSPSHFHPSSPNTLPIPLPSYTCLISGNNASLRPCPLKIKSMIRPRTEMEKGRVKSNP
jgi:hypothetical protein